MNPEDDLISALQEFIETLPLTMFGDNDWVKAERRKQGLQNKLATFLRSRAAERTGTHEP